jgi:hypothetical protein
MNRIHHNEKIISGCLDMVASLTGGDRATLSPDATRTQPQPKANHVLSRSF